jgi:hypothetical protein
MGSTYAWLWLYRGALALGIVAGLTAFGATASAEQTTDQAAAASGAAVADGPVFTKGEDGWWLLSKGGSGGVNGPGGGLHRAAVRDFWPAGVVASRQGFLATPDGNAVRVLASGYLTPLFDSSETAFPGGVVAVMKPYRAYYVVRKQGTALLISEPPFSPKSPFFWVRQGDCYVWATGKAAEVKGSLSVYASEDQARTSSQPLTPADKYTDFSRPAAVASASGPPSMTRMPVLWQAGDVAALLCPSYGGELCWANLSMSGGSILVSNAQ